MSVLFAFCVQDGGEDAVLDVLDDVLDAGVKDEDWEWLSWEDVQGRVFCVVRGTLASRGAFLDSEDVRQIRLSVAHKFASDNRCEWVSPRSSQDGRERLNEWLSDAGVEPLDSDDLGETLPPPPAQKSERSEPSTLVLRGRERLEKKAVRISDTAPESASKASGSSRPKNTGSPKGGGERRRRAQGSTGKSGSTSVLSAFRNAIHDSEDSSGQKFSLYGFQEDVDSASQEESEE